MRWLRRRPSAQLELALDPLTEPPRTAEALLERLRALGLVGIERCRLTRNRAVMVSFRGRELRVHEGYLAAPDDVLEGIAMFVCGRSSAVRSAGRRRILDFPVARGTRARRPERTRADDEGLAERLREQHRRFNARYFGGSLRHLDIRISRRMRTRLGHYMTASPHGESAEIVISRRHVRRHGWEEALHTLLHEMVHQWQDETGHAIDHGRMFRAKAREVGITPSACRTVQPLREPSRESHVMRQAAREE